MNFRDPMTAIAAPGLPPLTVAVWSPPPLASPHSMTLSVEDFVCPMLHDLELSPVPSAPRHGKLTSAVDGLPAGSIVLEDAFVLAPLNKSASSI